MELELCSLTVCQPHCILYLHVYLLAYGTASYMQRLLYDTVAVSVCLFAARLLLYGQHPSYTAKHAASQATLPTSLVGNFIFLSVTVCLFVCAQRRFRHQYLPLVQTGTVSTLAVVATASKYLVMTHNCGSFQSSRGA